MADSDMDKLLDHEYDGIREYDNPTPGWWTLIFAVSAVWGLGYFGYYVMGPGLSEHQAYDAEVAALNAPKEAPPVAAPAMAKDEGAAPDAAKDSAPEASPAAVAPAPAAPQGPTEESLAALLKDEAVLAKGGQVFKTYCFSCHGAKGEGGIGPNLTDYHWIHGGGTLMGIHTVVSKGVVAKGMAAWERTLSTDDLNAVVAYVGTMRGTEVAGGKKPQGDDIRKAAK